MGEKLNNLDC